MSCCPKSIFPSTGITGPQGPAGATGPAGAPTPTEFIRLTQNVVLTRGSPTAVPAGGWSVVDSSGSFSYSNPTISGLVADDVYEATMTFEFQDEVSPSTSHVWQGIETTLPTILSATSGLSLSAGSNLNYFQSATCSFVASGSTTLNLTNLSVLYTTTSAVIPNPAQRLDLVITRLPQVGAQGPQGAIGPTGPAGPVNLRYYEDFGFSYISTQASSSNFANTQNTQTALLAAYTALPLGITSLINVGAGSVQGAYAWMRSLTTWPNNPNLADCVGILNILYRSTSLFSTWPWSRFYIGRNDSLSSGTPPRPQTLTTLITGNKKLTYTSAFWYPASYITSANQTGTPVTSTIAGIPNGFYNGLSLCSTNCALNAMSLSAGIPYSDNVNGFQMNMYNLAGVSYLSFVGLSASAVLFAEQVALPALAVETVYVTKCTLDCAADTVLLQLIYPDGTSVDRTYSTNLLTKTITYGFLNDLVYNNVNVNYKFFEINYDYINLEIERVFK